VTVVVFTIKLYNIGMSTQETSSSEQTVGEIKISKPGRRRVASIIAAGATIGGHPQAPSWCEGYDDFKGDVASSIDGVGNTVEDVIDAIVPNVDLVHDPVFDPTGERSIG
jgi:pullulanase/glycogen debranching enzyme